MKTMPRRKSRRNVPKKGGFIFHIMSFVVWMSILILLVNYGTFFARTHPAINFSLVFVFILFLLFWGIDEEL